MAYDSEIAYLENLAAKGLLTNGNSIWKKLYGKQNVPQVKAAVQRLAPMIKG